MSRDASPRIESIERAAPCRVPMAEPHRTASGVVAESPLVLTDVVTDAGVVGHSMRVHLRRRRWRRRPS